ncbi:endolytic transglycosylase MltG [Yinghuangia sp. ASG 101]|uniref:endolytic transglycosylase MltG n=1 Tax=Yinghuangia sp. ASG 101 TaxID=2896848 RepID=UPI001E620365|nr:endolytic transglycosylase MltG [Yinghuangia sp. ASG 101]UGQ13081.1 endolytic transglycosylase MltG [Yinghuangia sp. ASG 101]
MSDLGLTMDTEPRSRRRGKSGGSRGRRKDKRGRSGCAVFIAFSIVIALVATGGWYAYGFIKDRFGPPPDYSGAGSDGSSVVVIVKPGWVASQIGNELKRAQIVKSVDAFTKVYTADKLQRNIEAAAYVMKKHMSAKSAFEYMVNKENKETATIPEGYRATKVYTALAEKMQIDPKEFETAAKDPSIGLPAWANGQIEGFLFPTQYPVAPGMKPVDVLRDMVTTANNKFVKFDLENRARAVGKTPYEVLIIASMVQAEAKQAADFGKISRVIYNRLESKPPMNLGFDSTVNYGLDRNNIVVTNADTKKDHPWNTYLHPGLPETPINNPGEDALEAALDPTPGDMLYFVTVNLETGETKYAKTAAEHEKNKEEFEAYMEDQKKKNGG